MSERRRRLALMVPAGCAILVVLRLLVLRSPSTSDFSLGISVGLLLGVSILSLIVGKSATARDWLFGGNRSRSK